MCVPSYRNLNLDNDVEIEWAARVYCESPRFWIRNWQASLYGMNEVVSRIRESNGSADRLFLVAEAAPNDLVGFHWLVLERSESKPAKYSGYQHDETAYLCARRVSLWVHEIWWNQGVATELMTIGERWARSKGAERITASVHFSNTRMIDLNVKRGFEPRMMEMSKDLSTSE